MQEALRRIREKFVVLLATGCYAGYIPIAPGTFSTLIAIPFCYILSELRALEEMLFIIAFTGSAVWISGEAEKVFKKKDN